MTELLVKSRVTEYLDEYQVSAEFYPELNAELAELIADAADRAEANDRTTVMPYDL